MCKGQKTGSRPHLTFHQSQFLTYFFDCFHTTVVELRSYNRDFACKAHVFIVCPLQKNFAHPCSIELLGCMSNFIFSFFLRDFLSIVFNSLYWIISTIIISNLLELFHIHFPHFYTIFHGYNPFYFSKILKSWLTIFWWLLLKGSLASWHFS